MSENPYQSPGTVSRAVGVLSGKHEDLRSVAYYQKGILVCILIYVSAFILGVFLPPGARPLVQIGVLGVGLAGTVFVFLLAMKVYGTALGIVLGILTLIPCVGLITLLIVNGKATSVLRANGCQVGLLGADLSKI
jgi:hypothetical protein